LDEYLIVADKEEEVGASDVAMDEQINEQDELSESNEEQQVSGLMNSENGSFYLM